MVDMFFKAILFPLTIEYSKIVVCVIILSFLVVGPAQYFFGITSAIHLPFVFAVFLYLKYFFDRTLLWRSCVGLSFGKKVYIKYLKIYALIVLVTTIYNLTNFDQLIVGFKNYLSIWSILLLFTLWNVSTEKFIYFWRLFVFVACVQLPVCLYQYFVYYNKRIISKTGGIGWDSIVGTFGGDPFGGGNSGGMAMFLVVILMYLLLCYENKILSAKKFFIFLSCIVPAFFIAEVKIVFMVIPLAFLQIYYRTLIKRPLYIFGAIIFMALAFGYLAKTYAHRYDTRKISSLSDVFEVSFASATDPNLLRKDTGEMGRVASVKFWWDENGFEKPVYTLIGHGLNSSRSKSSFAIGSEAKKYIYNIDNSSFVVMLWDIGILGTLAYIMILVSGMHISNRLSKDQYIDVESRVIFKSSCIFFFLTIITLPYSRSAIDTSMVQVFLAISLGHCAKFCKGTGENLSKKFSWLPHSFFS